MDCKNKTITNFMASNNIVNSNINIKSKVVHKI